MRGRVATVALLPAIALACAAAPSVRPADRTSVPGVRELVAKLTASDTEGRGLETKGLRKAEAYVADWFGALGLRPLFPGFFHKYRPEPGFLGFHVAGQWGGACAVAPAVVLGAHLDHLGLENGQLHPGANDNASGVAGVVEAARALTESTAPDRCYLFVAFTGEESGAHGSSDLAKWLIAHGHPVKAMINLDMIGKLNQNRLEAYAAWSSPQWPALLGEECSATRLDCFEGTHAWDVSDHLAFTSLDIPAVHLCTSYADPDWHRPSDTPDKLNYDGLRQVAALAVRLATRAGDPGQKLVFAPYRVR